MANLIPEGIEIAPYYYQLERKLQPWIDADGKVQEDAPKFIKDDYVDLMDEIEETSKETGTLY